MKEKGVAPILIALLVVGLIGAGIGAYIISQGEQQGGQQPQGPTEEQQSGQQPGESGGEIQEIENTSKDTEPPHISSVNVGNITGTSAIVTWETNEKSNSTVIYQLGNSRQKKVKQKMTTNHSVKLEGLRESSQYSYEVKSTDKSGNTGEKYARKVESSRIINSFTSQYEGVTSDIDIHVTSSGDVYGTYSYSGTVETGFDSVSISDSGRIDLPDYPCSFIPSPDYVPLTFRTKKIPRFKFNSMHFSKDNMGGLYLNLNVKTNIEGFNYEFQNCDVNLEESIDFKGLPALLGKYGAYDNTTIKLRVGRPLHQALTGDVTLVMTSIDDSLMREFTFKKKLHLDDGRVKIKNLNISWKKEKEPYYDSMEEKWVYEYYLIIEAKINNQGNLPMYLKDFEVRLTGDKNYPTGIITFMDIEKQLINQDTFRSKSLISFPKDNYDIQVRLRGEDRPSLAVYTTHSNPD